MKKTVFLLLLLAAMFAPWAMMAQEPTTRQLTVYGSGHSSDEYIDSHTPIAVGHFYYYTKSQTAFPAKDIERMTGGTITHIKFYSDHIFSETITIPVVLYMKEIEDYPLSNWLDRNSCTTVYEGCVSFVSGEMTIELSTPFVYHGGHLVFGCENDTRNTNWTNAYKGVYASGASYGYHTDYWPQNLSVSGRNFLPKTTFTFIPPSCSRPTGLSVSAMTPTTATLSWTENGEATAWDICLNEDEDNLITANANPYTLTGLNPGAPYSIKVRANCGTEDQSEWSRAASFMPADRVAVGSGEQTSPALPTDFFRRHNISQQIYTVSELGSAGAIMGIDLFKEEDSYSNNLGRNLKIYMVNTDLSTFGSTSDWISVTEDDLVYDDVAVFANNEWTTIEFSRPFNYDGSHNVAVVVCDNTAPRGGEDGWIRFRSFKASETDFPTMVANNDVIYDHGSTYSIDATNITVAADSISHKKNQMRFLKIACIPPTGIAVSDVTTSSATLSWTERGAANSWVLEYSTSSDFATTIGTINVSNSPAQTLSGLTASTQYYVRVRANCGSNGGEYWSVPFSFSTDCSPENKCEIFYELATVSWSGGTWYGNGLRILDNETGTVLANLTIGDYIYDWDTDEEPVPYTHEETDGLTYARGSIPVCNEHSIRFEWIPNSNSSACLYSFYDAEFNLIEGLSGEGYYIYHEEGEPDYIEDVVYHVSCTPNSCPRPTHVAVAYEGGTTATVTWDNVGSDYEVDLIDHGTGDIIHTYNATTNSYTLTGLELGTTYDVQVVTVCDRGDEDEEISHVSRTVTFTTDLCMPEDQCAISYELYDASSDGWDGNAAIVVVDATNWENPIIIDTWTLGNPYGGGAIDEKMKSGDVNETEIPGSYKRGTLGVCDGSVLQFFWRSGSCDGECTFTIYDASGAAIVSGRGSDYNMWGYGGGDYKSLADDYSFIESCDINCSATGISANSWYAISTYLQGGYSLGNENNMLTFGDYDLYRYKEADATWENYKSHSTTDFTSLETGRGYIYRRSSYAPLAFEGTENAGTLTYSLSYTNSCPDADLKGFNLIGNPYPHSIVKSTDCSATGLATGYYSLEGNGSWLAHTDSDPINKGQAVLVKVSAGTTLTFTDNAATPADPEVKGSGEKGLQFILMGDEYKDVAYALFTDKDGLPKVGHLNAEAPSLSIAQGGTDYAIATIGEGTEAFPLKFRGESGEYTMEVRSEMGNVGFDYLHLIDRLTGSDIDLLRQPTYTFAHTGNQALANRFMVKLSPEGESTGDIFAYQNGDRIVVEGTGTLQVYDVLGRQLFTHEINSQFSMLNSQFPSTGVYILRLNGKSQKLVIK